MTACENTRELLGAWLDGEIGGAQGESVRAHLEECVACQAERRRLERLNASLRSVLRDRAPRPAFDPFWRAVAGRIAERRSRRERVVESLRDALASPRLVWAVPALIAVLIGVVSLEPLLSSWRAGSRGNFTVVESINAHGRSVGLFREDETKTTVIWLYQNQEDDDEAPVENSDASPAF
ncbi:MAG TPA: zf-HC2 domain-containing protein [candidate division Zixibacteria bacterium]|nr:zf-HC2 domain-containing protein [candidate division Zixibacteria bacterium]